MNRNKYSIIGNIWDEC